MSRRVNLNIKTFTFKLHKLKEGQIFRDRYGGFWEVDVQLKRGEEIKGVTVSWVTLVRDIPIT